MSSFRKDVASIVILWQEWVKWQSLVRMTSPPRKDMRS